MYWQSHSILVRALAEPSTTSQPHNSRVYFKRCLYASGDHLPRIDKLYKKYCDGDARVCALGVRDPGDVTDSGMGLKPTVGPALKSGTSPQSNQIRNSSGYRNRDWNTIYVHVEKDTGE
ncbi:hypothetical protein EVAR_15704_1 [Eumeta japonica]|uniref:Uncharacterized protein n=1 Tax=Eumeta variegata TaxID=151549 RepID=A0A4C1UA94_EUMVA|nr:hypothetical protein EVAR_15704_1 [Eumeta japonica]